LTGGVVNEVAGCDEILEGISGLSEEGTGKSAVDEILEGISALSEEGTG
jgi:hypothetical protein